MDRPDSPFTPAELSVLMRHVARRVREKRKQLEKHLTREQEWTRGPSDWQRIRHSLTANIRENEDLLTKIERHRADLHRYENEQRRLAA